MLTTTEQRAAHFNREVQALCVTAESYRLKAALAATPRVTTNVVEALKALERPYFTEHDISGLMAIIERGGISAEIDPYLERKLEIIQEARRLRELYGGLFGAQITSDERDWNEVDKIDVVTV